MTVFPIEQIMNKIPMDPALMGIKEYLEHGATVDKITPLELADSVEAFCNQTLKSVESINAQNDIDLRYEVSDIRTWAYLGICFANRLRAAIAYQQYMDLGDESHKTRAIELLEKSLDNWKNIVTITEPIYNQVPLVHNNSNDKAPFHWSLFQQDIENEIEALR
jgi:hypothetical protein